MVANSAVSLASENVRAEAFSPGPAIVDTIKFPLANPEHTSILLSKKANDGP
jgi:hypothetical protein